MLITLCAYLFIAMTILGFTLTVFDRFLARSGKKRLPETLLFTIACLLGAVGVMFGFFLAKRGVYSSAFRLGIPAIAVGELILLAWMVPSFFKTAASLLGT